MSDQPKRFFDLWFVEANNVVKEVPFHVVTDWVQQGRAVPDDRIKPSGTAEWYTLGTVVAFQPYFPQPDDRRPEDAAEAMAPVDMELEWKNLTDQEDEDVDMIPLIDISLVLLIFFMMTMTVASISRIRVPDVQNITQPVDDPQVLRIDMDLRIDPNDKVGRTVYSLGIGTAAPSPEEDNLASDVELMLKLDERLRKLTSAPKVRIAAHGDIPYYMVEEVLKGLERRREKEQITQYAVEVNERAK